MLRARAANIQVTERDGLFFVGDDPEPFQRGQIRTLHGSATQLVFIAGYSSPILADADDLEFDLYFSANVLFEDEIRIAGTEVVASNIGTTLRPSNQANGMADWCGTIGFMGADWEIGTRDTWYIEAYIPVEAFNNLLNAYKSNSISKLNISMRTELWTRRIDWHTPIGAPLTWFLLPGDDGSIKLPRDAAVRITNLSWHYPSAPILAAGETKND